MRRKSVAPDTWLNWPQIPGNYPLKEGSGRMSASHAVCLAPMEAGRAVQVVRPICHPADVDDTDEALLQAVIKKDSKAFEMLYDRHASFVYNLLVCIVRNESLAEELLQETFWQVWQKASQYSGIGAGVAWIHQIARHKALDQLRCQKARPAVVAHDLESLEWAVQSEPSAESEFEQNWTRQQVQQALAHIPCEQRLCLELAYFEGLSHQEIAEQTNTPLGTIKTRIRIGMKKLERELLGRGYLCPMAEPHHFAAHEHNAHNLPTSTSA